MKEKLTYFLAGWLALAFLSHYATAEIAQNNRHAAFVENPQPLNQAN